MPARVESALSAHVSQLSERSQQRALTPKSSERADWHGTNNSKVPTLPDNAATSEMIGEVPMNGSVRRGDWPGVSGFATRRSTSYENSPVASP